MGRELGDPLSAPGEVVATGLSFPEGPVVLPDGRIAFCEEFSSQLSVFDGSSVERVANTGGAPNGAALGSDGALYVCQNGGVCGEWRADPMIDASIQRVTLDGEVSVVSTSAACIDFRAPNDLCFGSDGRLYFNDPAHAFDFDVDKRAPGRIFALGPGGESDLVLNAGVVYNNGIGFLADGRLCWVETYNRTVMVLEQSLSRTLCTLPENHYPDGFAVATDGRIFIATVLSRGITVVTSDGVVDGFIPLDGRGRPTNCAFDGSTLWVTDAVEEVPGAGRLWRIETDAIGLPLHAGAL